MGTEISGLEAIRRKAAAVGPSPTTAAYAARELFAARLGIEPSAVNAAHGAETPRVDAEGTACHRGIRLVLADGPRELDVYVELTIPAPRFGEPELRLIDLDGTWLPSDWGAYEVLQLLEGEYSFSRLPLDCY